MDRDRSFVGEFAKSKLSLKKQTFWKTKKIQTFCKKKNSNILQKPKRKNKYFAKKKSPICTDVMELIMFSSSI